MNLGQWLTLITTLLIAFMSMLTGLFVYIVKGAYRWARTEEKLEEVVKQLKAIVDDKDEAHRLIHQTLRDDREATNRRLRWLEEHLWRNPKGNAA
ncbi:MAG TPA: hypothetical protein VIY48_09035 [Candidatus Paceibacterota bacterium]